MSIHRVWPLAPGANTGADNWTDAWVNLQSAIDSGAIPAYSVVYCRGVQAITSDLLLQAINDGIQLIGVDDALNDAEFKINGQNTANYCLAHGATSKNNYRIKNFNFYNAKLDGFYSSNVGAFNPLFENCIAELCGRDGFSGAGAYLNSSFFKGCISRNNTRWGFYNPVYNSGVNSIGGLLQCKAHGNGGGGVTHAGGLLDSCLLYDNTGVGLITTTADAIIKNCIIYRNTTNGIHQSNTSTILLEDNRIFGNNKNIYTSAVSYLYAKRNEIVEGATANIDYAAGNYVDLGGNKITGTNGCVDPANGNFNTRPDADLRRTEVDIDGTNKFFVTAGIPGADVIYPRIDSIDKTVLPLAGGTIVATGIGLTGATGFTLGGVACTVVVDSDTQITITVPTLTAGLKSLAGTTTAGAVSLANCVTAQAGASAPGAFVLTATARPTSMLLQWTNSIGYSYFDTYQGAVKINSSPIRDAISYLVEGLTEETSYTFKVTAVNGTGSTDSNTVTKTTLADGYLPTDTVTKQLLEILKSQILAIKDSTAAQVFSSDNVVIGYINDLAERTAFPCVEIYPTGSGSLGSSYESQRTISSEFTFSIVAHQRVATTNRDNGTDLYEINQIGEAIRAQIFRLNDLSQAGTEPCTGFVMVQPTYTVNPQYEVFSEKVNSVIVDCAIRADNEDVGI